MAYSSADNLAERLGLNTKAKYEDVSKSESTVSRANQKEESVDEKVKSAAGVIDNRQIQNNVKRSKNKNTSGSLFPSKTETKDTTVSIRVTSSEYNRWKCAARDNDVSFTVFLETVLNDFCNNNGY